MNDRPAGDAIGSASEEAAKLIAMLADWIGDHVATGDAECQLCPVCTLIRRLREANPEAVQHLAVAGLSLAAAVRAFLEGPAGRGGGAPDATREYGSSAGPAGPARIDIAGDED